METLFSVVTYFALFQMIGSQNCQIVKIVHQELKKRIHQEMNFTFKKEKKVPSEHNPVVGRKPLGTT